MGNETQWDQGWGGVGWGGGGYGKSQFRNLLNLCCYITPLIFEGRELLIMITTIKAHKLWDLGRRCACEFASTTICGLFLFFTRRSCFRVVDIWEFYPALNLAATRGGSRTCSLREGALGAVIALRVHESVNTSLIREQELTAGSVTNDDERRSCGI